MNTKSNKWIVDLYQTVNEESFVLRSLRLLSVCSMAKLLSLHFLDLFHIQQNYNSLISPTDPTNQLCLLVSCSSQTTAEPMPQLAGQPSRGPWITVLNTSPITSLLPVEGHICSL